MPPNAALRLQAAGDAQRLRLLGGRSVEERRRGNERGCRRTPRRTHQARRGSGVVVQRVQLIELRIELVDLARGQEGARGLLRALAAQVGRRPPLHTTAHHRTPPHTAHRPPPARRPPPPAARPSAASAGTAGADMPPHPFGSRAAVRRLLALVRTHNISLLPVGALQKPGATPGPRELATEELYGIRQGGGGQSGGGGHDDDDDDDDDSGDEGESGGEAEGEE